MNYAGMPEDTSNLRHEPCGCELVRVALPGNPWHYLRRCADHQHLNAQQRGRMGAHSVHARGLTNTAPARAALEDKFRREVDPEGVLPEDELESRVTHAKSLYYARIAQKRWAK